MTWPRDRFAEAVWASDLRTIEKIVALCYADHARDQAQAFVKLDRLMARTGLSRGGAQKALTSLREAGWLTMIEPARQHRSPVYGLSLPSQSPTLWTSEDSTVPPGEPLEQPRVPPHDARVPPHDASGSPRGPYYSSDLSSDLSRRVAEDLSRRLGCPVSVALAACEEVETRKSPADLAAYVSRFTLEDLERWASKRLPRPTSGRRQQQRGRVCSNGAVVGLEGGVETCCPEHDDARVAVDVTRTATPGREAV